jgi:hypothetical protein
MKCLFLKIIARYLILATFSNDLYIMIFGQYGDDTLIVHVALRSFLGLNYVTQITVQNKIGKFLFVNW